MIRKRRKTYSCKIKYSTFFAVPLANHLRAVEDTFSPLRTH